MSYIRDTNQSGGITDNQFKELLETVTSGLNPVKIAAKFSRTPRQASIEKLIYYSTATGIKL